MQKLATFLALTSALAASRVARADDGVASVAFTSTKPQTVLYLVLSSWEAGTNTGVRAGGVEMKPLCQAPCKVSLPAGYVELIAKQPSALDAYRGFQLRAGENEIRAEPGSRGRVVGGIFLASFGLLGGILGGVLWGVSGSDGGKVACVLGVTGVGVSIPLIASGFSDMREANVGASVAAQPLRGVRVSGRF